MRLRVFCLFLISVFCFSLPAMAVNCPSCSSSNTKDLGGGYYRCLDCHEEFQDYSDSDDSDSDGTITPNEDDEADDYAGYYSYDPDAECEPDAPAQQPVPAIAVPVIIGGVVSAGSNILGGLPVVKLPTDPMGLGACKPKPRKQVVTEQAKEAFSIEPKDYRSRTSSPTGVAPSPPPYLLNETDRLAHSFDKLVQEQYFYRDKLLEGFPDRMCRVGYESLAGSNAIFSALLMGNPVYQLRLIQYSDGDVFRSIAIYFYDLETELIWRLVWTKDGILYSSMASEQLTEELTNELLRTATDSSTMFYFISVFTL